MRDAARASIFGEQTADRLDLSGFTPRPASNTTMPDRDAVRREEAVLECHATTGAWTYLLKLRVADLPALDTLLNETLRAIPGVQRVETLVALSTVTESATLPVAPATEE